MILILAFLLISCTNSRDKFLEKNPNSKKEASLCIDSGDVESCYDLGVLARSKSEIAISKGFFSLACQNYHHTSCFELGLMSQNEVQRTNYFQKACYLGSWKACDILTEYFQGKANEIEVTKYVWISCRLRLGGETCGAIPAGIDFPDQ